MEAIVFILLLILLVYLLAIRGRIANPALEAFKGWNYAHRGLHGKGRAENSLSAFRAAVEKGYGAEFDVHLLKDGNLAVIHDSSLKRVTGQEGRVEDLTTEDLKNYRLEGTEDCIPTFREVLDVFHGKTPIIIELKAEENAAALCEAACKAMEGYEGLWCMESFDPRCVIWLKNNRPEILRGQLAHNSLPEKNSKLPTWLRFALTYQLENFLGRPDFIAYDFGTRKTLSNFLCRKFWRMGAVSWTLRSPEEHATALKEGWIPIFEHYEP